MRQKGVHAFGVEMVAGLMPQIGARRLDAVRYAVAYRDRIVRDPHEAAGEGGGPADGAVLLRHDHLKSMCRRGRCRGQTTRAGADHQHIATHALGFVHSYLRRLPSSWLPSDSLNANDFARGIYGWDSGVLAN